MLYNNIIEYPCQHISLLSLLRRNPAAGSIETLPQFLANNCISDIYKEYFLTASAFFKKWLSHLALYLTLAKYCGKVISRSWGAGYFPLISQALYGLAARGNNPGCENNFRAGGYNLLIFWLLTLNPRGDTSD